MYTDTAEREAFLKSEYEALDKWYSEKYMGMLVGTQGRWRESNHYYEARIAWMESASRMQEQLAVALANHWLPIESAPYDTLVIIETHGGHIFKAKLLKDHSLNEQGCVDQWVSDDIYPECWSDGCCWKSNSEEEMSDPPVRWHALISQLMPNQKVRPGEPDYEIWMQPVQKVGG